MPLSPPCVPVFLLFGRHSPPDTSPLSLYPSTRPLTVHARSLAPDAPSLPPCRFPCMRQDIEDMGSSSELQTLNTKEAQELAGKLVVWYDANKRDLPWRHQVCLCLSLSLSLFTLSSLSISLSVPSLSCTLTGEVSCRLQMRADTRCNSENYS